MKTVYHSCGCWFALACCLVSLSENIWGEGVSTSATASRVTEGLVILDPFDEGGGTIVHDRSGYGAPLDLQFAAGGGSSKGVLDATTATAGLAFDFHFIMGGLPERRDINVPGDIDRDGDIDVIQGGYYPPLFWLEYQESNQWVKHNIDNSHPGLDPNGVLFDVDGDGDLDLIAGGNAADRGGLYWWECPSDPKLTWTRRTIDSFPGQHHDQAVGDVNRDGKPDLVFWHQGGPRIYWVEIPSDPRVSSWHDLHVLQNSRTGEGLAIVDLDKDGDNDVVAGSHWYEAPADPTAVWSSHQISSGYDKQRLAVGDLNHDGRLDVVMSEGDVDKGYLGWFEASDPRGAWTEHRLRSGLFRAHTLELADFDVDGDLDILVAEMDNDRNPDARAYIYTNVDGHGTFVQDILSEGIGFHEGKAADIDADGDVDIIGKTFRGSNKNNVEWWENMR